MKSDIFLSVLIPVYNGGETLSFSLDSLLAQEVKDVQLVIVNDCSTDNTECIITDYEQKFIDMGWVFTYCRNAINFGVAESRNIGLENAIGEYVCYLDSDDLLSSDALSQLRKSAKATSPDIIAFNWYLLFSENKRLMIQPRFVDKLNAIENMFKGTMRWNLWSYIVKRSIYESHSIRFISDKNIGEDLVVTVKLFAYSERVEYLSKALYLYNQGNVNSISKVYTDAIIEEITYNLTEVCNFVKKNKLFPNYEDLFMLLKLNLKLPLLVTGKYEDYLKWLSWFPESNKSVFKNNNLSLRVKVLQYMAALKQYWFVNLHYNIIIKFVYGIIYK